MAAKEITEVIVKNLKQYTLILIGVILVLVSANTFSHFNYSIEDTKWRIIIASLGAFLIVANFVLIFRDYFSINKELRTNYEIEIDFPTNGDQVRSPITILGRYKKRPPDNLLHIFEFNPGYNQMYHKGEIKYEIGTKKWSATIHIGNADNLPRNLRIIAMGGSGLILIDYYNKVLRDTGKYIGITKLTTDTKTLAEVRIVLT